MEEIGNQLTAWAQIGMQDVSYEIHTAYSVQPVQREETQLVFLESVSKTRQVHYKQLNLFD